MAPVGHPSVQVGTAHVLSLAPPTSAELTNQPRCVHSLACEQMLPLLDPPLAGKIEYVSRVSDARFGTAHTMTPLTSSAICVCFEERLGGSTVFVADEEGFLACAPCRSVRRLEFVGLLGGVGVCTRGRLSSPRR